MPCSSSSPYETVRQQRIEQNQKRLQELGIRNLSDDLRRSFLPPTPSSGGKARSAVVKEKVKIELRRSSRNSGNPRPEYREVEVEISRRVRFDGSGGPRHYSRLYERKYASDEARAGASFKAEAIKERLPLTNPSFVKPMLQSHVTGGFWLGLPVVFCRNYLPKDDTRIILEDEKLEEWETLYLANRTGLSGGWRGFSLDHGLVDGDALVFELVQPHRFKVHIVRAYEPGEEGLSKEQKQEEIRNDDLLRHLAEQKICDKTKKSFVREADVKKGEPESDEDEMPSNGACRKLTAKELPSSQMQFVKFREQRADNECSPNPGVEKDEESEAAGNAIHQKDEMKEPEMERMEEICNMNEDVQAGSMCEAGSNRRKRARAETCEDGGNMKKPKEITSYMKAIKSSARVAERRMLRKCSGRIEGC